MDAVTVVPGQAGTARLEDVPEPDPALGSVLGEALAVGVCGTDVEIASARYGWPPPGREWLVLGHESIGRVVDPGPSGFSIGDLVVGIVETRRGALPELRRRRVGHVQQRGLHRAWHKADRRLHVRAVANRAGIRGAGRSCARGPQPCSWSRPRCGRLGSRSSRSANARFGIRKGCWSLVRGRLGSLRPYWVCNTVSRYMFWIGS